jgi:hypothetical protein
MSRPFGFMKKTKRRSKKAGGMARFSLKAETLLKQQQPLQN